MEEAKFSINIKYRQQGYECQLTMRADTGTASEQLILSQQALNWLAGHGAEPTNGRNGKAAASPEHSKSQAEDKKRVCPVCGKDDELELIKFEKDGKPRQAYKCQRCKKWLPGNGGA